MTQNVAHLPGSVPVWSFADYIRKVRRDRGLTQEKFAAELGVGEKAYAAWESGKNEPASIRDTAERLEAVTGVPRQWFLGWMDDNGGPRTPGTPASLPHLDSNQEPSGSRPNVIPLFTQTTEELDRAA